MSWFERLTGFREISPRQVRENLMLDGETLRSRLNGRTFGCGRLETPSLGDLRDRVRHAGRAGRITVREIVADIQNLHADLSNAGALFQVASQFNLLEMTSPGVTPEQGVGIYEHDHTQGPACAIAAGAGTIYRNYFAPVAHSGGTQTGQTAEHQLDCLADLGEAFGNANNRLWTMRNGYALASEEGLVEIGNRLRALDEVGLDALRTRLRIGLHWNPQVTLDGCSHTVSQAYCSALPVAYSRHSADLWAPFARLVLEASYEATVCAAVVNSSPRLFLTLLGGGAFGNPTEWILAAMERALRHYQDSAPLDVAIVSYGASKPFVRAFADRLSPQA